MSELSKIYQAENYEDALYQAWEKSGAFKPGKKGKAFSIVLPPPNVTGKLHIGHAAMLAYQDVMVRYHRLQGDKTLWLPGMDHAAIATQNVVEKELKKAGHSRYDLGRPRFLNKVEAFAEDSKKVIRGQIKKMGSSLDWSRERFTLDESSSLAVKTAFKKMYDDGLIYRGERVVNWCPRCQSTLADDEVEHREEQSKLYYIKYGHVTVATTRPETKLGDTGVAVNPKDERYKKLVGEKLVADLMGNFLVLKVFADREVDMTFGTGAIGVTPAHSQTDYQWALKNDLSFIKVINEEGKMTEAAGQYQGLTVKECREKLVADLQKAGKIEKIEEYTNNLSVCYRCGTTIEPLTSKQWFVAVDKKIPGRGKTLKQLAIEAVKKGGIKIIPDRFNKTYFQWMDNLRDWCISRQIWYGHRIPVWYNQDKIFVGLTAPTGEGWIQDEDTLDTWFSSSLWTFSTLGWPKKTPDLKTFHPTSVMETGYDILFFWVARMILMSTYLIKEVPFKTVYLHGLVRDKEGRKMSKSLGNGIDPLDMIAKFGADALRLSLLVGATPGNDARLYEEKIAGYRNFVNKLWNISRYILSKSQETNHKKQKISKSQITKLETLADKWILGELDKIIASTAKNIEEFKFSAAGEELYEFTWSKLADWYLEVAKIEGGKDQILLSILEKLLILWHPFCPFVTEAIWSEMGKKTLLMIERWPKVLVKKQAASHDFELIQQAVTAIRNIRSERQISPKEILDCSIKTSVKAVKDNLSLLAGLAGLKIAASVKGITVNSTKVEITLAVQANAELDKKRAAEAMQLRQYIEVQQRKLKNQVFVSRAPKEVILKEKEKLKQAQEKLQKLS
ncbi:MAG: valine--tRNA ligase [Candidatus Komeilibacteria bacterium]|nr:valine--tRNA ligase [Candidatus Komeilibacteria bacterium]